MEELDTFTPQVFGRYLLIRRLSRGGMGEVYLAKSGQISGFEKLVVIKRILPHLSSRKDFSKRFIQEANIAIKLSQVNIVPVLEVGKVQGEFFLALEHVEGRDLRSIQSICHKLGEPLPPFLSLLIVRDMLTGLSYAHRREDEMGRHLEIVHCDISPPNILISYEGEVKIIDFGIAKSVIETEDAESSKMGFGKFGYMAPEQILKGEKIDTRTDLYSAGVVLWELLTGQKLIIFDDSTPFKDIAKKVVLEVPPDISSIVPDVGPEIDRILKKALSKNKEERYQNASEFRDDVQLALVQIAPTVTNETLGTYLKELFEKELNEYREIIRQAKEVDLEAYQMELTTAMEETVSFAVGDDWREMTGPLKSVSPVAPESATADSMDTGIIHQPTPTSLIGEQSNPSSKKLPFLIIAILIGATVLGALGYILLDNSKTESIKISSYSITVPSMVPKLELPDMTPPDMIPEAMKPVMKTTEIKVTMKKPVMHHVMVTAMKKPVVTMKVIPMAMNMEPEKNATDKNFQNMVKGRLSATLSRYNRFKASHGGILNKQFKDLRAYSVNSRFAPDFWQNLNNRISYFNSLMNKYGK
ncbi:MAG: serine/threonine protein kinase [Deltaproteobacteria bacterium]|nr:serine/threonine protein kinase [Deltaproteobacteria bacterium]